MREHVLRYAPVLLLLVITATGGCSRAGASPTSPSSSSFQTSITAEPLSARPEFLPSGSCTGRPPFGVRVFINLRGRDVVLRGLSFQFIDLVGHRTLPEVIALPSPTTAASSLPASSPVAIPGIAALPPLPQPSTVPLFARFGCGVIPEGTLIITGDVRNHDGREERQEMKVRVEK